MLYLSRFFGFAGAEEIKLSSAKKGQVFEIVIASHTYLSEFEYLSQKEKAPRQWGFICQSFDELQTCKKNELQRIQSDLYFHIGHLVCDLVLRTNKT